MAFLPILQPSPPLVLPSDSVTDLITGLVCGTTGLAVQLVRPRWQPTPPSQPTAGINWCGVGIISRSVLDYTHQELTIDPVTQTEALLVRRWGELEVLASFYGPRSDDLAEQFRDGCYVTQNLEALYAVGVHFSRAGDLTLVPDLVNMQYIGHSDIRVWFSRELDRYYPLASVIKSQGIIEADDERL